MESSCGNGNFYRRGNIFTSKKSPFMIIFTDLDNCLLDSKYSAFSVRDFVQSIVEKEIIISIISSKTAQEILYFLGELGIQAPFAAENGGLVEIDGERIELGTKSEVIIADLNRLLRNFSVEIEMFTEMEESEIKDITKLPEHLIPLAKHREFSEPFRFLSNKNDKFLEELQSLGYTIYWGGNFYQVYRGSSKGRAVRIIKDRKNGYSVGIGDSPNDYSMLDECDYPIMLNCKIKIDKYESFRGFGPLIWKKVVKKLLEEKNV